MRVSGKVKFLNDIALRTRLFEERLERSISGLWKRKYIKRIRNRKSKILRNIDIKILKDSKIIYFHFSIGWAGSTLQSKMAMNYLIGKQMASI